MDKVHEKIKAESVKSHNSASTIEKLKEHVARYVECDMKSQELNDRRTEIREEVADLGLDTKAFQDAVARAKKDRRKKDGYDESMRLMTDVLGDMDQDDLFSYLDERERAKEEEREARAKEKERAKKLAEKPADGTKKKGKEAASGEKTEDQEAVGVAQAKAFQEAHGKTN